MYNNEYNELYRFTINCLRKTTDIVILIVMIINGFLVYNIEYNLAIIFLYGIYSIYNLYTTSYFLHYIKYENDINNLNDNTMINLCNINILNLIFSIIFFWTFGNIGIIYSVIIFVVWMFLFYLSLLVRYNKKLRNILIVKSYKLFSDEIKFTIDEHNDKYKIIM